MSVQKVLEIKHNTDADTYYITTSFIGSAWKSFVSSYKKGDLIKQEKTMSEAKKQTSNTKQTNKYDPDEKFGGKLTSREVSKKLADLWKKGQKKTG